MSRIIYIGRECFHVEGEKHFAAILEEKLGRDAAELFLEYIAYTDPRRCEGECDRLYEMQEDYERAIRDALDDLQDVEVKRGSEDALREAVAVLKEVLT